MVLCVLAVGGSPLPAAAGEVTATTASPGSTTPQTLPPASSSTVVTIPASSTTVATLATSSSTTPATLPSSTTAPSTTATSAPATSAPATTAAPAAPTTVPGASIVSKENQTAILSVTDAQATTEAPTTTTTTRPPPPAPRGGATAPAAAAGTPSSNGPGRLLAAVASARRELEAQITDAEDAVRQRQSEADSAEAKMRALEATGDELGAGIEGTRSRLVDLDAAVVRLSAQAAGAAEAAAQKTPPVAYPPARGYSRREQADRAQLALEEARRARGEAATTLQEKESQRTELTLEIEEERAVASALAGELERRRNVVFGLRQQLDAVASSGLSGAWNSRSLVATGGEAPTPSPLAVADIPPDYAELYQRHARVCPGLSWTVLAAIGSIESSHGRAGGAGVHQDANEAGAMGPMQFLASTWSAYGRDGDGDGLVDVYNPSDAIAAAAGYLCANGGGELITLSDAIWHYNHADWYVAAVVQLAAAYGGAGVTATLPSTRADVLVDNTHLTLSPEARADLLGGVVDQRVVDLLAAAAADRRVTVSVIQTGHTQFVAGTDRVSNHYGGRAVDISAVDGVAVSSANTAALELSLSILSTDLPIRPDEFGSPWVELSRFAGTFSDNAHGDHLHFGWAP